MRNENSDAFSDCFLWGFFGGAYVLGFCLVLIFICLGDFNFLVKYTKNYLITKNQVTDHKKSQGNWEA